MLKILAIGNSFSRDATAYLYNLAKAETIDIKVVNLCIGGCSLETHWNNCIDDKKDYLYELNGVPTEKYISIKNALKEEKWDYITLQQVSYLSVDYNTYQPYLQNLSEYIKKHSPEAEHIIHQTWAYEQDSDRLTNELKYNDQWDMFYDLKLSYEKAAKNLGDLKIIPCGLAFQNALKMGFENLHIDTFHASIPHGRYLLGAVWYEFFTGENVLENGYCPEGISEKDFELLKVCAHNTIKGYTGE